MKKILFISIILLSSCSQHNEVYNPKPSIPLSNFDKCFPAIASARKTEAQGKELDESFAELGIFRKDIFREDARPQQIAITDDCKILVLTSNATAYGLFKISFDGSLDKTFGNGGFIKILTKGCTPGFGIGKAAFAIQEDQKIVIAGCENNQAMVRRFLPNGKWDYDFATNGVYQAQLRAHSDANAIAIKKDGKILVAGALYRKQCDYTTSRAGQPDQLLFQLNTDGKIDKTFGQEGHVVTYVKHHTARAIKLLEDAILVQAASERNVFYVAITKFDLNGIQDRTFGENGYAWAFPGKNPIGNGIEVYKDKIIVGGVADNSYNNTTNKEDNFYVAKFHLNGKLDESFGHKGIAKAESKAKRLHPYYGLTRVKVQENGKIVVSAFSADLQHILIRFNENGDPDKDFAFEGQHLFSAGYATGYASDFILSKDGYIYGATALGAGAVYHPIVFKLK